MKLQTLVVALLLAAGPLAAQTKAELQAELEAQKEINALLKQRIISLEAALTAKSAGTVPGRTAAAALPPAPPPSRLELEEERALERALVRRGSAVLAPGVLEITPSFGWSYDGRDALQSTDESRLAGLDVRLGLENGWMIGAGASLQHRDIQGLGSNSGAGDTSLSVWKELGQPGANPSYVAGLSYSAPTGEDFGEARVPLGSGFHTVTGRISAVKTIDPLAFFGDLTYTHRFSERFGNVRFERAGAFGAGLGASLAVTPDISSSAALRFVFEDEFERNGVPVPGTSTTAGTLELGLGVLLRRDVFMNLNAAFGITGDAPDSQLLISFPLRF